MVKNHPTNPISLQCHTQREVHRQLADNLFSQESQGGRTSLSVTLFYQRSEGPVKRVARPRRDNLERQPRDSQKSPNNY